MRISDWSSDVCSSDLFEIDLGLARSGHPVQQIGLEPARRHGPAEDRRRARLSALQQGRRMARVGRRKACVQGHFHRFDRTRLDRSEEHTSELQSLMRSSYAVFCLKKKNQHVTSLQTSQTT